jgi:hypothetical protein
MDRRSPENRPYCSRQDIRYHTDQQKSSFLRNLFGCCLMGPPTPRHSRSNSDGGRTAQRQVYGHKKPSRTVAVNQPQQQHPLTTSQITSRPIRGSERSRQHYRAPHKAMDNYQSAPAGTWEHWQRPNGGANKLNLHTQIGLQSPQRALSVGFYEPVSPPGTEPDDECMTREVSPLSEADPSSSRFMPRHCY